MTDHLVVDSVAALELYAAPGRCSMSRPRPPTRSAIRDEWSDLGALAVQLHADPAGRLRPGRGFRAQLADRYAVAAQGPDCGITGWVRYQSREDEGTQSPMQTLDRGWGSCRDFAVLFVEAARSLGFGRPHRLRLFLQSRAAVANPGRSTHAWAEVFVPGAGWITFDPTNRGSAAPI